MTILLSGFSICGKRLAKTLNRNIRYHAKEFMKDIDIMSMPSGWSCAQVQELQDEIKALEAKNGEFEKKLKELEDKEANKRIDLMSLASTHTKAVKHIATLEKKLEIAYEALEKINLGELEYGEIYERIDEALSKIKSEGL